MLDRFNRADGKPPASMSYDKPFGEFQGGAFNGVRDRLNYIKDLGGRGDLALTCAEEPPVRPRHLPWLWYPGFPSSRAEVRVGTGQGGGRAARTGGRGARPGSVRHPRHRAEPRR